MTILLLLSNILALILIDSFDPCAARLLTFEDNFFASLAVTRQDDTHIH